MTNLPKEYIQELDGFKREELLKQMTSNLKITNEKINPVYKKSYDFLAKFPKPKAGRDDGI